MNAITLSREELCAIIDEMRQKGLDSMLDHAGRLEQHGPDEPTVTRAMTDDLLLRSSTWARAEIGILLPDQASRSADQKRPNAQLRRHQPH